MKPEIMANEIKIETLLQTMSLNSEKKANSQVTPLTKDRGDYEPEDDASFGDLW